MVGFAKSGEILLGEHGRGAARALGTEVSKVSLAIDGPVGTLKHLILAVVLQVATTLLAEERENNFIYLFNFNFFKKEEESTNSSNLGARFD